MRNISLSLLLLIYSCSSANMDNIHKVYDDRNVVINLFLKKSIMRSRGQNIILFYTHEGNKTNKYFFEINNNQYQLINDSLQYASNTLQLKNKKGSDLYKQELTSYIKMLISKMDELKIRDIKGDLADVGIDLRIYMKQSNAVLIYVSNLQGITSSYWKNYIKSMKKLDDNWYCTMKE